MINKLGSGISIFVLVTFIFFSCQKNSEREMTESNNNHDTALKNLEWIVSTWKQETLWGTTYESWRMVNDTLWKGKGYRVTGTDTVVLERLSLEVINGEVFYVPVVPHNEGAVYFKMTEQSEDKVIFENPEHDFPQRIIYLRISNDSLHVKIEGLDKGVESNVDFYFRKTKK